MLSTNSHAVSNTTHHNKHSRRFRKLKGISITHPVRHTSLNLPKAEGIDVPLLTELGISVEQHWALQ